MDVLDDVEESGGVSGAEVFEILAADNADMLVCYLRTLVRDSELVEDLFQEVMLVAWKKLAEFDRSRPFGPWLRGIAINKVRQHRARRARDILRCDSDVVSRLEDTFASFPQGSRFTDTIDGLLMCLNRLPDRMRLAIEMVYQRGLSMRRGAGTQDCSEEAFKKRVQRGRRLLAECLREEESGS